MSFLDKSTKFLGGDRVVGVINRASDVLLALFIIVIIMMIIIPISHTILDNLIALNFAVSISLLMVALYIPRAVNLSIFPSILLITTLFRLGIEISATVKSC